MGENDWYLTEGFMVVDGSAFVYRVGFVVDGDFMVVDVGFVVAL